LTNELSADPLLRYAQLRDSRWLFLKHCILTKDEADPANPIKPYPAGLQYLKFIVLMWEKYLRIAIPKSRRMTISWTCLALILHDIIFFKGRAWAVLSKKENDARELVSRIEFMFNHIPEEIIAPALLPKMKRGGMQSSPPAIEFQEIHSSVKGFPQGGEQLRQYGFTGIFEDECAFQDESADAYVAAEPTIGKGGRFIKVSSRAIEDGGFFKKIVFDQINAVDMKFAEVPPVPVRSPMEGIEVWKNPNNGFLVIDLHYTANPDKRGHEFREALRKVLPIRKFEMEYGKSWSTYEGKPVYEDFNPQMHVTHEKPKVWVGLPLLLGWDSSGLTPACVVAQLQLEQLVVIKEIIGSGMGAERFVPLVASTITTEFPQITDLATQTLSFFDPAGFKKNEITEETYLSKMIAGGFKQIRPGPMTWKKRVDAVTKRLVGLAKGQPKILVYESGCPTLVAGFKGGFRYSDKVTQFEPDAAKALKDAHSHPHDGLQYLCGGLEGYRAENYDEAEIPTPTYGFQKTEQTQAEPEPRKNYGRLQSG
jgi:hypothetical protein